MDLISSTAAFPHLGTVQGAASLLTIPSATACAHLISLKTVLYFTLASSVIPRDTTPSVGGLSCGAGVKVHGRRIYSERKRERETRTTHLRPRDEALEHTLSLVLASSLPRTRFIPLRLISISRLTAACLSWANSTRLVTTHSRPALPPRPFSSGFSCLRYRYRYRYHTLPLTKFSRS